MPSRRNLNHIKIFDSARAEKYKPVQQGGSSFKFPSRPRKKQSKHLLTQLKSIKEKIPEIISTAITSNLPSNGIVLEFSSKPGFNLALDKLDFPSKGIELVNVANRVDGNETFQQASVFVPQEKISVFIKKVEEYRDKNTKSGKPRNQPLINSIENIRVSVLKSLWTDDISLFPFENEKIWWEVWLRKTDQSEEIFRNFCQLNQIEIKPGILSFPDRIVLLTYSNASQMTNSIEAIGLIAELRIAKECSSEFLNMHTNEQAAWIEAARGLLTHPNSLNPRVCILDTGVDRSHKLIEDFLPAAKVESIIPASSGHDHDGHGTGMAGIVLYNNLEQVLVSTQRTTISCNLESVKILPPPPRQNDPQLYGSLTEEAVAKIYSIEPTTNRMFLMAVTAPKSRDRGKPSSWSSAVDKIAGGCTIIDTKHLVILSAGNCKEVEFKNFPASNETSPVQDPAQSWNALVVGSYTEKVNISDPSYSTWQPIAKSGDISPSNTTSLTWEKSKWPIKPDVVFEGGNAAINPTNQDIARPDSMIRLSTNRALPGSSLFTWMADTSAASAEAAHFASKLMTKYPQYWPETIRALIVHSASWTAQMLSRYPVFTRNDKENLLRVCGYGVPSIDRALHSTSNHLTLIAEESIVPYSGDSMKELKLHHLPWPKTALEQLGDTEVKMRVTLSYFIEPNPGDRGWTGKYKYQSHALRFKVKTDDESIEQFKNRINKASWGEENGQQISFSSNDTDNWYLGPQVISKGSIHSDYWKGKASDLAKKDFIAIYPVMGWWREKYKDEGEEKEARYSLIVSIETPETDIDIYTPVENTVTVLV